jgi:hypothetical protein
MIHDLAVQIIRFTEDGNPGWITCEFRDAEGRRHTLIDKVPIFTAEDLDAHSQYPRPGVARCEALSRWRDADGRERIRISTERPDAIESTEGLSEFVVLAKQLHLRG